MDIKPHAGDCVVLASGGPSMTVVNELDSTFCGQVICKWFDSEGKVHEGFFPFEALREVDRYGH